MTHIQCSYKDSFLDGALSDEECIRYQAHLADCDACSTYIQDWNSIGETYGQWAEHQTGYESAQPDRTEAAQFLSRIQNKIEASLTTDIPKHRFFNVERFSLLMAAAAILMFGVLGFLYLNRLQQSAITSPAENGAPAISTAMPTHRLEMTLQRISSSAPTTETIAVSSGYLLNTHSDSRIIARIAEDTIGLSQRSDLLIERIDTAQTSLRLQKGIAVFDVASRSNDTHFVVSVKNITITVIGTRFAVEINDRDVVVRVAEGTVRVNRGGEQLPLTQGHLIIITPEGSLADMVAPMSEEKWHPIEQLLSPNTISPNDDVTSNPTQQMRRHSPEGRRLKSRQPTSDMKQWRKMIIEGKYRQVDVRLQSYLQVVPNDDEALMLLAISQKKSGQYEKAFQTYKKVISLSNAVQANRARYIAGELAGNQLGRSDEAVALFESYLVHSSERSPNRGEAKLRLSKALLNIGQNIRAKIVLKEIIDEYKRAPVANRARKLLGDTP